MGSLRLAPSLPDESRSEALRTGLGGLIAGWRPLARNVLGADERIDWVGRDGGGRCVIALADGSHEDLGLVALGLAQREWLTERLPDWVQLAPDAGLRPEAGVTVWLLATEFSPAARAAARAVADQDLRLARMRFVENGSGVAALLEPLDSEGDPASPAPHEPSTFRSGLSASELDLTPEERSDLARE